jgi:hypothetical protein
MPGLPPVKVEAPPGVMGLRHHSALSARATMTNPAQFFGRAQPRKKKKNGASWQAPQQIYSQATEYSTWKMR